MLARLGKMAISGAVASAVDLATLLLCAGVAHLAAGPAAAVGCLVGGVVNFALARRWVFAIHRRGRDPMTQVALYGLLVVLGGALLCGALVELATTRLGLSILAAKLAAAVLVLGLWNYPVSTFVVFQGDSVPSSGRAGRASPCKEPTP